MGISGADGCVALIIDMMKMWFGQGCSCWWMDVMMLVKMMMMRMTMVVIG